MLESNHLWIQHGGVVVYHTQTGNIGNGPFGVNSSTRVSSIIDGTSNTIAAAEVNAYQPNIKNCD